MRFEIKSKIFCLLLTCGVVWTLSQPLQAEIRRTAKTPLAIDNRWAVQFALDESITDEDGNFCGGRISFKHQVSDYGAVRLNLGFFDDNRNRAENEIFHSDYYYFEFHDWGYSDIDGGSISVQYLFCPPANGPLQFYFGLGPIVSVSEVNPALSLYLYDDFPYVWAEYVDYGDNHKIGLGLEGALGMEYFLGRNFSLLAEYNLIVQQEWYALELEYYDRYGYRMTDTEYFDNGINLDASRLKLGVSFYF